jgi:dihydroorotate dehydrogenase (fumarate)
VVIKSIFEEEVALEYADFMKTAKKFATDSQYFDYDGRKIPIDYYNYVVREENLKKYVSLIEESKKAVSIPVIASINCFCSPLSGWPMPSNWRPPVPTPSN